MASEVSQGSTYFVGRGLLFLVVPLRVHILYGHAYSFFLVRASESEHWVFGHVHLKVESCCWVRTVYFFGGGIWALEFCVCPCASQH